MARAVFLVALSLACGGRTGETSADASSPGPHGPACTEDACASSVSTITTMSVDSEGVAIAPTTLFVGGGWIYTNTKTHIVRAPVGGGSFQDFADTMATYAILADGRNVYWSGNLGVFWRPHDGGDTTAVPLIGGNGFDIFIDSTNLFCEMGGGVVRASIPGGNQVTIPVTTSSPNGPAVLAGGRLFGSDCVGVDVGSSGEVVVGNGMIADDTHCYVLDGACGYPDPVPHSCGNLVSIPIGGGTPTVLLPTSKPNVFEYDTMRMMIDKEGIYLRRAETGAIIRVTLAGVATDIVRDVTVAFDVTDDAIYWAAVDGDVVRIQSMPKYSP